MIPAKPATQNVGRAAIREVVERVLGPALAHEEQDAGDERDGQQAQRERLLAGTGRKLIAIDEPADQERREEAADVVHRLGRLVHVRRDQRDRQQEGEDGERQRDEEDRAPVEVLEQRARYERAERGDPAAERRPERDRLRPGRARTRAP